MCWSEKKSCVHVYFKRWTLTRRESDAFETAIVAKSVLIDLWGITDLLNCNFELSRLLIKLSFSPVGIVIL